MRLFFLILIALFFQNHSEPLRRIENSAFVVGEKLKFSIGWEFISAGTAELTVENEQIIGERPCYYVTAVTKSNAFFSTLYPVRDKLETFIDKDGLYPLRYIKNTSEGNTKRNFEVQFDQSALKASMTDRDSGQKEISVPAFVQDIISAFYYMRNQPMEIGKSWSIATFDNGKVSQATVKVLKKEKISVTAGEFDCVVVSTPIGPFNNKSDLSIWLTDDSRRMPVLMKSKIAIGSIHAELESFESPSK